MGPLLNTIAIEKRQGIAVNHLESQEDNKLHQDTLEHETAQERRVRRKIDAYLMPSVWLLLILNYVDRSNVGNAYLAGMGKDLKLSSHDYYIAVIVFQVAYVVFAVPSNLLLVHIRPSIYISTLMFLWGVCVIGLGVVQTKAQLIVVRFLLGIFEAGFAPAVLYLITSWYRRAEQAKRILVYFSGAILAGAFGAVVAGGIAKGLEGAHGLAGWRWLFLVEGIVTVGVALGAPFILLDLPSNCKKFSHEERQIAMARVQKDGIRSSEEEMGTSKLLRAAWLSIMNWRIYFAALPYMQVVGSSALGFFYPTMVRALGYTDVTAQFMVAPLWAVAFAIAIPTAWLADHIPRWRGVMIAVDMAVGGIFCAIATGVRHATTRYVCLCFTNASIWAGACIVVPFAAETVDGASSSVRAVSMALLSAIGNSAVIYGSALFPKEDGPDYLMGFATTTALFFFGGSVAFIGHFLLKKYPYKPRD